MKKLFFLPFLLFSWACTTEFNPYSEQKSQAVTYCILDLNDSLQTLRLSRTFTINKDYINQESKSIESWNEEAEIYIEENPGRADSRIYYFHLKEDFNQQDSGYFTPTTFQIYESQFLPKPETQYSLYVFIKSEGIHCYATTSTVGVPVVNDPLPIPGREISFSQFDDYLVHFYPPVNSSYHDCYFEFDQWIFGRSVIKGPQENGVFLNLSSERFFRDISALASITRTSFHIYSYGEELALYNNLYSESLNPWEVQSYSTFQNGVGLFSSKYHHWIPNLEISEITQELINQEFTIDPYSGEETEFTNKTGSLTLNFELPPSVLPENKVHRLELKLAYNVDSLYKQLFFATTNVYDSKDEYSFKLLPGEYYYQTAITCSCLSDSCLWDGYPDGRFGIKYAVNKFTINKGQTTIATPSFQ